MAIIHNTKADTIKTVKNLGWLLRNASKVKIIEITPQSWYNQPAEGYDAKVTATLDDGRRFITDFASIKLCRTWFKRPSLSHATFKDYSLNAFPAS